MFQVLKQWIGWWPMSTNSWVLSIFIRYSDFLSSLFVTFFLIYRIAQREKFSRRKKVEDDDEITYINKRNKRFNEKIGRFYDKYTKEIKGNLKDGSSSYALNLYYLINFVYSLQVVIVWNFKFQISDIRLWNSFNKACLNPLNHFLGII